MNALPAYGRKYANQKEVLIDWLEGKDFKCQFTGQYFSIRDTNFLKASAVDDVFIVYGSSKIVRIKL